MTHIEKMKQWLETMEKSLPRLAHYGEKDWLDSKAAITSLRQGIAEVEKENALRSLHNENERLGLYEDAYAEQEPVAWKETHGKVIKALAGIVNVHTPDKLFDLDAIPRESVMGLVQQIKVAIDAYKPQRTEQEPVAWMRADSEGNPNKFRLNPFGGSVPLYTTPPQRTKVVFPTMLRKMWSGGEVQAWLDENVNKENT